MPLGWAVALAAKTSASKIVSRENTMVLLEDFVLIESRRKWKGDSINMSFTSRDMCFHACHSMKDEREETTCVASAAPSGIGATVVQM